MKGKLKICLGFATAPLLAGLILGVLFNVMSFVAFVRNPKLMGEIRAGEGLLAFVVYPVAAEFLFLIPCLIAALIVICLRPSRTRQGFLLSGAVGGFVTTGWIVGILAWISRNPKYDMLPSPGAVVLGFLLGTVVFSLISLWVLPRNQAGHQIPVIELKD